VVLVFLTGIASAQTSDEDQIITLQLENDYFGNTDQHFTNGFRAAWMPSARSVPQWVIDGASFFPLFDPAGKKRVVFSLGQSIFTPDDLSATIYYAMNGPMRVGCMAVSASCRSQKRGWTILN